MKLIEARRFARSILQFLDKGERSAEYPYVTFHCSTNFDASKIRREGFRQPVSNEEEALRRTVDCHLHSEYSTPLPRDA